MRTRVSLSASTGPSNTQTRAGCKPARRSADSAPSFITHVRRNQPNGPLAGGATRSLILGAKDISVKAAVDFVVYADATAEVLNEHAFSQIVAIRKGHLIAMQKVGKVIKQVLADPTITNPGAAAAEELRREIVEAGSP